MKIKIVPAGVPTKKLRRNSNSRSEEDYGRTNQTIRALF
jgi:hypothetical protein